MPLPRPSVHDLAEQAQGLFARAVGGVSTLRISTFRVFGKVAAALIGDLHLRLDLLYRQTFVSTATDAAWIRRHGFEQGVSMRGAARARGLATVAAPSGAIIVAGARFQRPDGAVFATLEASVSVGGTATLSLEAEAAGMAGNTAAASQLLALDAMPAGAAGIAIVASGGLGGGAEIEDIETYRGRILARKQAGGETGKLSDWARWAGAVPGVIPTRVFVASFINGSRGVWIAFLVAGRPNGIPTSQEVAAMQAYLDQEDVRPVMSRPVVVAPVPVEVPITIQGLSRLTDETKAAVSREIAAAFAEKSAPARPGHPFTFYRSWIGEAISLAAGEVHHTLVAPAGNVTVSDAGAYPVPGTISWT
jgi:uncharacterized phage protein gp47/JayE